MNLKEIDKIVGSIQSHLFKNSNSFSVGMLKSHFKGAGLQFKEHQIYNPGDDVRFIDWKLSAKTNTTFVKTFEEERNVDITVFLDLSESMFYGYQQVSKLQVALELSCLLYLLAEKSKDRVSLVLMNGENPMILPHVAGHEGIAYLISQLEKRHFVLGNGKINYALKKIPPFDSKKIYALLKNLVARGKEVVILADLNNFEDQQELQKLLYRKNLHCFSVTSPIDEAEKLPYAVFGRHQMKRNFSFVKKNQVSKELRGRIKKIGCEDRYLEDFVREML